MTAEHVALTITTADNNHLLNLLEELARVVGRAETRGEYPPGVQRQINMIRSELSRRLGDHA